MARIISVQPHLEYGGSERQSVLLANELVRRGVESEVVAFEARGGLREMLNPEVHVHDLGLESHLMIPEVARRLHRTLSARPPSLVILKLWSALMAGAMIEHRLPQHKFVFTEDLDPADHADFIRFGKFKQRIIRSIFRSRTRVTANTFAVRDAMIKVYGLDYKPQVISSAVDFATLDESRKKPDDERSAFLEQARPGELRLISVGSLGYRKGLDVTRDALAKSQIPARWLILGEGPLGAEIPRWEVPNVEIMATGGVPRPYDYMRLADLLIHSARSEAFGIVLLESLGVGTPVITSATIGGAEIARTLGTDSRMLQTYPVENSDALASLLRATGGLTERPSVAEFRAYSEPYALSRTADRWIELALSELAEK